jgi:hypothetical protein
MLLILVILCAVLGYGYWHAVTHAGWYIDLQWVTEGERRAQPMPGAEVTFLDDAGNVLARGTGDSQYNFLHLLHPEAGDCHEIEQAAVTSREARAAWQECFEKLSTWVPTWAKDVRRVEVLYGDCRFENIPVTLGGRNSEWYLWWVPLRHVGGKHYSWYRATISVNQSACVPTGREQKGSDLQHSMLKFAEATPSPEP